MATPNIDHEFVRMIAADTDTPEDTVSRMFEETWADYSDGARIMDYLSIFVARRVRHNLKILKQELH